MFEIARTLAAAALAMASLALPALAQDGAPQQTTILGQTKSVQDQAPSLDTLLQQFDAQAPEAPGGVRLDAWIEIHDAGKEVVVVVTPEGNTKLVADPGITVTPASRLGVAWQGPLPHRMVDPGREYLDPPAMVRLPLTIDDEQPVQLLVEYAYCLVDYQCFLGEEELTVATVVP
jgi:hypothetical protein